MSADVDHDVDMDDFFGNTRQYYVTGYYKLQLTVHTPEGDSIDLPGYYDHVTDAETWIEENNTEYVNKQEQEEYEREEREQIESERMERHSLL